MNSDKTCHLCGQGKFPFKNGVCTICGEQAWIVSYVDSKQHLKPTCSKTIRSGIDSIFSKLHESNYEFADC